MVVRRLSANDRVGGCSPDLARYGSLKGPSAIGLGALFERSTITFPVGAHWGGSESHDDQAVHPGQPEPAEPQTVPAGDRSSCRRRRSGGIRRKGFGLLPGGERRRRLRRGECPRVDRKPLPAGGASLRSQGRPVRGGRQQRANPRMDHLGDPCGRCPGHVRRARHDRLSQPRQRPEDSSTGRSWATPTRSNSSRSTGSSRS